MHINIVDQTPRNLYTRFVYPTLTRPHRLVARTSGFHPGNRGSIPLGATKKHSKLWVFFDKKISQVSFQHLINSCELTSALWLIY